MRSHRVRELSVEEIRKVQASYKEDLDRKQEQFLLKDENRDAYAAMMAKRYVEQFVCNLELLADSHLQEYVSRPARARPIHINKALKVK